MKLSFIFIFFVAQSAFSATIINNTAKADYSVSQAQAISYSNLVTTVVCTQANLEYLKYAPLSPDAEMVKVPVTSYLDATGSYNPLPPPVPLGSTSPLDISNPVQLVMANVYHAGEPIFFRLSDGDQNIDPEAAETILLVLELQGNGEKEILLLSETGPNTGIFVGYIQSAEQTAVIENGIFSVKTDSKIVATYLDRCGRTDTGTVSVIDAIALVDPFGVVFDSLTGEPVNGAIVTIENTVSGQPAVVYGDDGVSIYPSTVTTGGTTSDSSGVLYTFSPGQYRFPFVQPGTYRLVVTPPATHRWPSTVSDFNSLPGGPFAIEIGSKGEEFIVDPGPALHIDIPIDPIRTWLYLTKTVSKSSVSIGDFLQYRLTVENTADIDINDIMVTDRLPLGFRYRKGSAKINGIAASDPSVSADGRTLMFGIGTLAAGKTATITYVVEIAAGAKLGKAINFAVAAGSEGAVSNTARAEVIVKEDLFGSKTIIMGRVFPGCENHPSPQSSPLEGRGGLKDADGVAGVRIYLEDGTYVVTDKNGMFHFEGVNPGTHVVQLDTYTIPEGYELTTCEENNRFAGVNYSQFVDLQGGTMWRADFYLSPKPKKEETKVPDVEIKGNIPVGTNSILKITESEIGSQEKKINSKTIPEFDNAWLGRAETGLAFVWPPEGFYPPIPSVKIAVKHDPSKNIKLLLNGEEVDSVYLDGTKKRIDNQVAVSLWIGIHIKDGNNLFEAVQYNPDGTESKRITKNIHYSGPPIKAALVAEKSRLVADGRTPPIIAVRLTDKYGQSAREGLIGEYKVNPPYLPLQKLEELQKDPLTMSKSERLNYVVGEDGIALIELMPTSQAGEVSLRFNLVSGESVVSTWLVPGERDWILVGLAEGTVGYNTVSGNMESLENSDIDDKYYKDGRLAFFAKGMIKGKWLLTIAYDSNKNGIKRNNSLYSIIDPDKYYTLYGDASQQQYEAASARALYIKVERDRFYALFGDYATGLTMTELSRYSRNLNGFKSEMKGEKFDFNIFASDTNQAFVKDEIRGDGTSGLYRLSKKNIVINSESVTIETRDRFRSEVIISSQKLTRHIDYNIDYDAGTIYFKSPVHSRDENLNPVYIIIDYESFDPSDISFNYGGRGAVRLLEDKLEVGATYIHEGRIGGEGNLTGIDAKLKLNDKTDIRAEFAATDTDFNGISSSGNAYLAEATHRSEKMDGKVYIREQESEFGLGQQSGSESGTRKIGLTLTYRLNEKISFDTEAFRQYNLATDAVRDMAEAQARYNERRYEVHVGLRHAKDTLGNGDVNSSEQLTLGGAYRMLNDRLIFRIKHDQSLFGSNENADYPTRTTIGADYKLNDTATFFVAQEFTQGDKEDTQTTRIGLKASPWKGGEISSSIEQQYTENGARIFSVSGIKQTWQITKKWSVDAGLDRSQTIKHPGNYSFNTNVPAASGGMDFTAASLGAAYKEEKWSWTGRIEIRDAKNGDKIGIFTGAYGEVRDGLGLAAAAHVFKTGSSPGSDKTSGDLRFSIAYRPKETAWIVLNRLDYLFDKQSGGEFNSVSRRIVNNMNINYKPDKKTQISLQYGAKYVSDTIDDSDFSGFTDLIGIEGRYDITKKWDIGLRSSVLHSWAVGQFKYSAGASIGYNLIKNIWISAGYNFAGFSDRDFSRAEFTSKGPYVKFRMKFDQWSVKDAVKLVSGH